MEKFISYTDFNFSRNSTTANKQSKKFRHPWDSTSERSHLAGTEQMLHISDPSGQLRFRAFAVPVLGASVLGSNRRDDKIIKIVIQRFTRIRMSTRLNF